MTTYQSQVLIVGGGNAALCAALAARERGADVTVLVRAPLDESGGNSRFTAGAFRCAYSGVEELRELMPDLSDDEVAMLATDVPQSARTWVRTWLKDEFRVNLES